MAKESWAMDETKYMSLKDKRRNARAKMLLEAMVENPASSISQACYGEHAATKGAYRLIGTTEVDEQDFLEGHYKSTVQKTHEHDGRLVIISDGMDVSLKNLKRTAGLGSISNSKKSLGIKMQNTYVFSEKLIPLGLINQKYWIRNQKDYGKKKERIKLNIREKESYSWIESIAQIEKKIPLEKGYVFLGDGAADIFDLFLIKRRANSDLLVHLVQNRNIKNDKMRLFESLANEPVSGILTQKLERTKTHLERTVKLEIRIKEIEIAPPSNRKNENLPTIKLTAICAQEVASDESVNNPIIWRLLTTIKVDSFDQAEKLITLYSKRWLIERYHYVLKEGFRVEKLQMESADNLKRALALYSIAASRLLYIIYFARIQPNASCSVILSTDEANALYCIHNKTLLLPVSPISIQEATRMIAKLGGFLGRKRDKEPGAKVLWQGLQKLEVITQAYVLFKELNVGNG